MNSTEQGSSLLKSGHGTCLKSKYSKKFLLPSVFFILSITAYSQTGRRISGSSYVNASCFITSESSGASAGYERYFDYFLSAWASAAAEHGHFEHSSFYTVTACSGAGYSIQLLRPLYLEANAGGFIGIENEYAGASTYRGLYAGFSISPELELHMSGNVSFSIYATEHIDLKSRFGGSHQSLGLKISYKVK